MINWKVRIKNKTFWITIIASILLLIQQVLALFGVSMDFADLSQQLIDICGTVFAILSIIGVVVDHTTAGIGDSEQALLYDEPKE